MPGKTHKKLVPDGCLWGGKVKILRVWGGRKTFLTIQHFVFFDFKKCAYIFN